jgi:UDPglucose 6-dehydrogenase
LLEKLYSPVTRVGVPLVSTDSATAELIKYASNGFLATKIAFINQMADIAEKVDADITKVALGMGLDHRISPHFLLPGPGYGGSCFPKDTRALASIAREAGAPASIIEEVITTNDTRKTAMVERIIKACGGTVQGKRIGVWGLAFKANTDDMRESPSLVILPALLAKGAQITACDPAAILPARPLLPKEIAYNENALATAEQADVLVILTEWPAFRAVDLEKLRATMKNPVIVDCRNVLDSERLRELGFTYYAIGKAPVTG